MRLFVPLLLAATPAMAQLDPWPIPARRGGVDICAAAKATAEAINPHLPREIAPGIRVESAAQAGPQVQLDLLVAADLRLPDEAGFARLACGEPPLAALIAQGGQVAYLLRGQTLATVTTCEAP